MELLGREQEEDSYNMTELNKNDCLTIKISKAEFAERFSHWEYDVLYKDDEVGGGTSTTSQEAFNAAYSTARDYLGDGWFNNDQETGEI